MSAAATYSRASTTAATKPLLLSTLTAREGPTTTNGKNVLNGGTLALFLIVVFVVLIVIIIGFIILSQVLCVCIVKYKSINRTLHIHQLVEENKGSSEIPYKRMSDDKYPLRFIANDTSGEEVYEDTTNTILIPEEEEYMNLKPGNINMIKNSAYSSGHQEL